METDQALTEVLDSAARQAYENVERLIPSAIAQRCGIVVEHIWATDDHGAFLTHRARLDRSKPVGIYYPPTVSID